MGKIGGIGLPAKEFKAIVEEVTEEAVLARQATYDTVLEVLSFKETVTPEEARLILARLIEAGGEAELAASDPKQMRQLLEAAMEGT